MRGYGPPPDGGGPPERRRQDGNGAALTTRGPTARPMQREAPPPSTISGRVPPHNLDAEGAVISAALLDTGAVAVALISLSPASFYSAANALVFEAISELANEGARIDAITVANVLRDRGRMAQIGGPAYLAQLIDATPAVLNVEMHCKIVRELHEVRLMIATCQTITAEGYFEVGSVPDWLDTAQTRVSEIGSGAAAWNLIGYDQLTRDYFARLDAGQPRRVGVPTGFHDLDRRITLGFGDLSIVAARPGMGKSSLALAIMHRVVELDGEAYGHEPGERVGAALFSLEMPGEQLIARGLAIMSGVDARKCIDTTLLSDTEGMNLRVAADRARTMPIEVEDTGGLTLLQLRARVRVAKNKLKRTKNARLRLVVVDYLQLMRGRGMRNQNREAEVAEISRGLKALAKEEAIHIMALSQLNRACEAKTPPRPEMSHLRESGAIEQDADLILLLYRAEYYRDRVTLVPEEEGTCEVICAKQRNGAAGWSTRLGFFSQCARFDSLAHGASTPYDATP